MRFVHQLLSINISGHSLKEGSLTLCIYCIKYESKEQKYLEAFCEHYRIDIEKKFSELSDDEIHQLLYADDQIKYKLAYKEGKRRKQHVKT